MMRRALCLASFLGAAVAAPLSADGHAETITRLEAAWSGWVSDHGVTESALAITHRGAVVAEFGHGLDPAQPVEMASLGKFITAVCIAALEREGALRFDQPVAELLPDYGETSSDITIAALLTHTSGLAPDETQGRMADWLDDPDPRHADVTRQAFSRSTQEGAVGLYLYNNENYAVLGEVVAQVTGQMYREACAERVLPASEFPSAGVSPRAGAFDAWGGWQMSVTDYARLHMSELSAETDLGGQPDSYPASELGGGAFYGMGTVWRAFNDSHNYWHFGALCFDAYETGSYAVFWEGRWGAVAYWNTCVSFESMFALDHALSSAAYGR